MTDLRKVEIATTDPAFPVGRDLPSANLDHTFENYPYPVWQSWALSASFYAGVQWQKSQAPKLKGNGGPASSDDVFEAIRHIFPNLPAHITKFTLELKWGVHPELLDPELSQHHALIDLQFIPSVDGTIPEAFETVQKQFNLIEIEGTP